MSSATTINPADLGVVESTPEDNYLTHDKGILSWIFTLDHKRIGLMYLISVLSAFALGGFFALLVRTELFFPGPGILTHDQYNQAMTLHGAVMVFLVIIPGIPAALGQDCVMDPWYSLGSGDMLEVAHMAVHVGQLTSYDAMRRCFESVTLVPAGILGLEGYGLEPGCRADMVILEARDPAEAIRLKAARLYVLRAGRVIAQSPPRVATLDLPGRPAAVAFTR